MGILVYMGLAFGLAGVYVWGVVNRNIVWALAILGLVLWLPLGVKLL